MPCLCGDKDIQTLVNDRFVDCCRLVRERSDVEPADATDRRLRRTLFMFTRRQGLGCRGCQSRWAKIAFRTVRAGLSLRLSEHS